MKKPAGVDADADRIPANRDDDAWFEALAGRVNAQADPATLLEAAMLRDALRRWPAPMPATVDEPSPEALLERAHAAAHAARGLGAWCAGCGERWRRWRSTWLGSAGRRWAAAAALGAAALALLLTTYLPREAGSPEERGMPVLRGDEANGSWLLRDADPKSRRDRIAAEIEAAGAEVQRYERLGRFGLEATVSLPLSPAMSAVLDRYALKPGAGGLLQLEVAAQVPAAQASGTHSETARP